MEYKFSVADSCVILFQVDYKLEKKSADMPREVRELLKKQEYSAVVGQYTDTDPKSRTFGKTFDRVLVRRESDGKYFDYRIYGNAVENKNCWVDQNRWNVLLGSNFATKIGRSEHKIEEHDAFMKKTNVAKRLGQGIALAGTTIVRTKPGQNRPTIVSDMAIRADEPIVSDERKSNHGKPVVIIDPGHGGSDFGAVYSRDNRTYNEADISRKIAQAVFAKLELDGKVDVKDSFELAGKNPATLWNAKSRAIYLEKLNETEPIGMVVSIHTNANPPQLKERNRASGIRILYNGTESNRKDIATSFYNTVALSMKTDELGKKMVQRNSSVAVEKRNDLVVLRSKYPSIMVETGFLDRSNDLKTVLSQEGQDLIANSIVMGIYNSLSIPESKDLASR